MNGIIFVLMYVLFKLLAFFSTLHFFFLAYTTSLMLTYCSHLYHGSITLDIRHHHNRLTIRLVQMTFWKTAVWTQQRLDQTIQSIYSTAAMWLHLVCGHRTLQVLFNQHLSDHACFLTIHSFHKRKWPISSWLYYKLFYYCTIL